MFVTGPAGTYLVFHDAVHMTRYYSNYISRALAQLMRPEIG
jgi:hypothetical protein